MQAIILEDEQFASNRLKRLLAELAPEIEVLNVFRNIKDTADYLLKSKKQPDIMFVDIQVEDGNSFELFNIVNIKSRIVFTTAYDEYAVDAFRKNATDYLLKPIKRDQLVEAIEKAKPLGTEASESMGEEYKSRFLIRFGSKLHSIKTEEIAYIYSKNRISYFYSFSGERMASDYKLQDLEKMLDPKKFFRANRQFIVHIDSITDMTRHDASRLVIKLQPAIDEKIVISTDKTRKFKQWLQR